MEIIAHRGESADAPENTLAAFRLALTRGVGSIELDVHLSADGDLIVCHDHDTLRTTGESHNINETSTSVLRSLDAGKWRGDEWTGEKLPLIEEVLETLTKDRRCHVEIKDEDPDTIARAVERLGSAMEAQHMRPEQIAVISFSANAIAQTRRILPQVRTAYLFWIDIQTSDASERWDEVVGTALEAGAHGLSMGHYGNAFTQGISRARTAGLDAFVWTVDDIETARAVCDLRPDGITSNNAAFLKGNIQSK